MGRLSTLAISMLLCAASAATTLVANAASPPQKAHASGIAPQPLADALAAFAVETGLHLIYPAQLAAGVRSPGAPAGLSPQETLRRLLSGTGLEAKWLNGRTVSIKPQAKTPPLHNTSDVWSPEHQLLTPPPSGASASSKRQIAPSPKSLKQHPQAQLGCGASSCVLSEVVVVGTLIRGEAPAGAEVQTISRQQIRESGSASLAEILQMQPDISASGPGELNSAVGRDDTNLGFASGVNLRGLGVDETLTLFDGHRLAPSGLSGQFADVSQIPLGIVEKVEILADGASATYGSDAMAGVINIIPRTHYNGSETNLRIGSVTDGSTRDYQVDQTFGRDWNSGNLLAAFEYYDRGDLPASDRSYAANSDLSPFGGADYDSNFSNPGNIISPAPISGAIPKGQNGLTLTPSQLLLGQTNLQNTHLGADLLPEQRRMSLFLSGSQDVNSRTKLYLTVLGSQRYTSIDTIAQTATLAVPATNAYCVANGLCSGGPVEINYSFYDDLGATHQNDSSQSISAIFGALTQLGRTWVLDTYAGFGRATTESEVPILDARPATQGGTLNAALGSSDLATAFNPFGDGSNTNPSVLTNLLAPSMAYENARYWSVQAKLDGSLIHIPGGDVKLAVGAEHRREEFGYSTQIYYAAGVPDEPTIVSGARNVTSSFGELYIPIFSATNRIIAFDSLNLSLSARTDHYSDFGSTTNPKIGLGWSPTRSLTLRSTYGTSFRAPLLSDLYSSRAGQVFELPDSFGGPDSNHDGFTTVLAITGGNPHLEPEKGRTWTTGIDWTPSWLPGFTASATYFNIDLRDRFETLASPVTPILDPKPYQGLVYFPNPSAALVESYIASASYFYGAPPSPAAVEAIIDSSVRNLSIVNMDGMDMSMAYHWDAKIGVLGLNANLTDTMSFRQQFSASAPMEELLNTPGNVLRLKLRGGVNWSRGPVSAALFVNYVGHYLDTEIEPAADIASWTTFDLYCQYAFDLEEDAPRWLDGTEISASIDNLFNRDPPFVNSPIAGAFGFDAANANPLGRYASVELTKKW